LKNASAGSRSLRSDRRGSIHAGAGTADFSYERRIVWHRWLVAGDAAGFIDPYLQRRLYSRLLRDSRHRGETAWRGPRARNFAFRRYQRLVKERLATYLKMSSGWYTQEFIEIFYSLGAG